MQTIFRRIKEWLIIPSFPGEEDKSRHARILYALLANMLFFLLAGTFATIFIFVQKAGTFIILFGLLLNVLTSYTLMKRGHVLTASRAFVIGTWIIFTINLLLAGRINTTFVSLQLAVTVMSSILLGKRYTIALTLLSILFGLGVTIMEMTGDPLVHFFPVPPLAGWMAWVLAFFLTLTPLNPIIQDVTRSTKALRESEIRFRNIYSQSPIAIELYDADGLLIDANPACLKLFGVAEVNAVKGFKLFDDPNVPADAKQQLLSGKAVNYRAEFNFDIVNEMGLFDTTKSGRCYLECDITPWLMGTDSINGYLVHVRDITKRVLTEEEYQTIIRTTMDGFWITDSQGNFLDVNDAYCQLIGYSREELLQMRIFDVDAVENPEEVIQHVQKIIKAGFDRFETKHRRKDGSLVDVEISVTSYSNGQSCVFLRDITERKQAEEALRESEERLEFVLEGSQLGYWDWNIETGRVQRNKRWAEMLGYTLEEIEFNVKQWTDLHHPDDRAIAWQSLQDHLDGRTSEHKIEYRMRAKDGQYKWILDQAKIVKRDPQGKPLRVSGTHTDITKRKEIGNSIERGRELLANTLDALPVGVCLTDEDGYYRLMNDAYCAIYEYKRDEMLGRHYSVIMPPDQVALANKHYARLLNGDVGIPVERKRQRKDGSIVYIEAANALVEGITGQKMVITTVRDITERKKAENITQARLRVNEFARDHTLSQLLQNALDELCALVDSPIGFFHFIEPDQRTLSLQAWSTGTLEEMCTAEGQGHSYEIEQAGVWMDCMRMGMPVIHNDYANLTHRKGLPKGHAPIIREMVFPIMRNQKMVAIIGVGNKIQEYTEDDLSYASRLADTLWDITERKQAEEREREQRVLAEAVSDSAAALNSSLDFENVLDRLMDNVGRVVPHDSVDVLLLNEDEKSAQIVGHRQVGNEPVNLKGLQLSIFQTPNLREMKATGKPFIIPNTDIYAGWLILPASSWIKSAIGVPIAIKGKIIGFLMLNSGQPNAFTEQDAKQLQAFVNHAAIAIENARLYEELQKLAVTDTLTGLYNRTFFETELNRMEHSRDFPISIIVADVDNLKHTNDMSGHNAGDELLKKIAQILQETFRAADIIARIGGDEFVALLPNTTAATSEQMLSRVREKLASYNAEHASLPIQLSLGTATAEQGMLTKTLSIADQYMYADKMERKMSNFTSKKS